MTWPERPEGPRSPKQRRAQGGSSSSTLEESYIKARWQTVPLEVEPRLNEEVALAIPDMDAGEHLISAAAPLQSDVHERRE